MTKNKVSYGTFHSRNEPTSLGTGHQKNREKPQKNFWEKKFQENYRFNPNKARFYLEGLLRYKFRSSLIVPGTESSSEP